MRKKQSETKASPIEAVLHSAIRVIEAVEKLQGAASLVATEPNEIKRSEWANHVATWAHNLSRELPVYLTYLEPQLSALSAVHPDTVSINGNHGESYAEALFRFTKGVVLSVAMHVDAKCFNAWVDGIWDTIPADAIEPDAESLARSLSKVPTIEAAQVEGRIRKECRAAERAAANNSKEKSPRNGTRPTAERNKQWRTEYADMGKPSIAYFAQQKGVTRPRMSQILNEKPTRTKRKSSSR